MPWDGELAATCIAKAAKLARYGIEAQGLCALKQACMPKTDAISTSSRDETRRDRADNNSKKERMDHPSL